MGRKIIPFTEDRFWRQVEKRGADECWLWIGGRSDFGYGSIRVNGKSLGAHRVSWSLANGDIPSSMVVRHLCDNPACVNPAHLSIGTVAHNVADRVAHQRGAVGERVHGARLTANKVREARERYRGGERFLSIATSMSVHKDTVRYAVRRITWKHVA